MKPDLSILPMPQYMLFPNLKETPKHFVLCGGTAIALRLGHRISVDFDFFSQQSFDPPLLYKQIPYLLDAEIRDQSKDTLTCLVNKQGPVKISFFGGLPFNYIEEPELIEGIDVQIASLLDLAGMKASVLQMRAAARDYIDIDALMTKANISLEAMLAAGQLLYGNSFNAQITLKALTYYTDGDLFEVTMDVRERLTQAAKDLNTDELSSLITLFAEKRREKDVQNSHHRGN